MSASDIKGATIDRENPSKHDGGETWEVTFPIVVDPSELQLPDELMDSINEEWLATIQGKKRGSAPAPCLAEIVGNHVRFVVPKSNVTSLENSIREMERLMGTEVRKYIFKKKREGSSETDLDDILNRLKKK